MNELDRRRGARQAEQEQRERERMLQDLRLFCEALMGTFEPRGDWVVDAGMLCEEFQPPTDADDIPLELLDRLRRQLAKFCKDARRAERGGSAA